MCENFALLSLLEGLSFRSGRRHVRIWNPDPLEGFLCNLVDHSLLGMSIFLCFGALRFLG